MNHTQDQPSGFADFVAGERAVLTRVSVRELPDGLELMLPDGQPLIWQWSDLRRLPDQADRDALVIGRSGDMVARLYLRDEGLRKDVQSRAPHLKKRDRTISLSKLAVWVSGAAASVAAIIFFLVPVMAAQLAVMLPPEGEKALGDTTFEQIRMALNETGLGVTPICEGSAGNAAMQAMYDRLNPTSDLPYDVQIHVLDHDMVNAFALPGGRIVFFRGLIEQAENPEEVAAVLAHEIGHVVNRDPTRDALRSAGSLGVLGLLFGDFAGGTIALFLANQLINASYSQTAEATADDYAHDLLDNAGVSPAALGTMFERLREEHGDAEGIVAHFMSHPQMGKRIAAAQAAVVEGRNYGSILDEGEWQSLRTVCGGAAPVQSDPETMDKKTWSRDD
ncbi:M48 family metallopeptidase [Aliiroseovarius sp. S1339]|uniref:M48 family metallopeptidase n=1 Tax=Aliiroseovarius sp. S1339 TaxID=2936990 RepID=UPI0020C0F437|nr:M48 family metallopeptidase [Aliiroseovarius sp. S1339]MCK8463881.1 M48 family metallopeptidase [Aliiroseovarius sp. S1339]